MGKKTKKPGKGKEKTVKKTAKAEEKRARRESKKISPEDDIDAILVFIFEFLWKLFKILRYLLFERKMGPEAFVCLKLYWVGVQFWDCYVICLEWSNCVLFWRLFCLFHWKFFLREIVFCRIIFWWELNYGTVMLYV